MLCVSMCILTSILSNVSDPRQGLIAALLDDLQVAYLYRGGHTEQDQASCFCSEPQRHMKLWRFSWSCQWSISACCNCLKMAEECCVLWSDYVLWYKSYTTLCRCWTDVVEQRVGLEAVNFQLPLQCNQIQCYNDSTQLLLMNKHIRWEWEEETWKCELCFLADLKMNEAFFFYLTLSQGEWWAVSFCDSETPKLQGELLRNNNDQNSIKRLFPFKLLVSMSIWQT